MMIPHLTHFSKVQKPAMKDVSISMHYLLNLGHQWLLQAIVSVLLAVDAPKQVGNPFIDSCLGTKVDRENASYNSITSGSSTCLSYLRFLVFLP